MGKMITYFLLFNILFPFASEAQVPVYDYEIVSVYPHDPGAFTQGLIYHNGFLYEGTGQYGKSSLRRIDLETGTILQEHRLENRYFGEGITFFQNRIYQLTWLSQIGFIYNPDTFQQIGTFQYPTQGWGLTHDGTQLIMSDGSSTLYFLNPETLEPTRTISVRAQGEAVQNLNELEYIQGEIYANIWKTDRIARIAPESSEVTGWIDLEGIHQPDEGDPPIDVLNGIAYDEEQKRLFVTGKLWSKLYEIKLIPREPSAIHKWEFHKQIEK